MMPKLEHDIDFKQKLNKKQKLKLCYKLIILPPASSKSKLLSTFINEKR